LVERLRAALDVFFSFSSLHEMKTHHVTSCLALRIHLSRRSSNTLFILTISHQIAECDIPWEDNYLNINNVYGIYIKTTAATYLLPIYKFGVKVMEIFKNFYVAWPTLVTQ
jgi:hypothetical protein